MNEQKCRWSDDKNRCVLQSELNRRGDIVETGVMNYMASLEASMELGPFENNIELAEPGAFVSMKRLLSGRQSPQSYRCKLRGIGSSCSGSRVSTDDVYMR